MAYDLTENPVVVTTLLGSRSIPWLVIGPFAGVMIDTMGPAQGPPDVPGDADLPCARLGQHHDLGPAPDLASVRVYHTERNRMGDGQSDQASHHYCFGPSRELPKCLSLVQLAFSSARIIFPIVGGLVIAVLGSTTINIFIQAVCYSIVFFMFYPLKVERPSVQRKTERRVFGDLVDGFKYATHQPAILGLIILGLVPSFFLRPFEDSMLPVFADDVLKVGAIGLGLLMSSSSVGNLVGTLLMASFRNVRRKGIALIMTAIAAGSGV